MISMHRDLEIRLAVAVDVGLHDIVGRDANYSVALRLATAVIGGETLGEIVAVGEMESLIAGLRTIGVDDARKSMWSPSVWLKIENRIPRRK